MSSPGEETSPTEVGLTIVGLGPGDPGQMSRAAWKALQAARLLLLRTRIHPTVDFLVEQGVAFESCDDLYESGASFEEIYQAITARVLARFEQEPSLVFAVPGHPLMGERAVELLRREALHRGIPVRLIPSPGFVDAVIAAAGLAADRGFAVLDATTLAHPLAHIPTLYYQLYSQLNVSELKLSLLEVLPPETEVWHVRAAGAPFEEVRKIPLYTLDRLECDHLTSLVIPPAAETPYREKSAWSFEELKALMAALRGPGGCPWDREQTHRSLCRYVIEEAYEVVDCIERGDLEHLPDELGDLLLQVIFQAGIAEEEQRFDVGDVIAALCNKLVRRHPHVFGAIQVEDSNEVIRNWEKIKSEEKRGREKAADPSLVAGIPVNLPALARADAVFRKVARVGFDWPDTTGPLEKIAEELQEIRDAIAAGDRGQVIAEMGDLFLAAANAARKLDLDPDQVTREALIRFIERFRRIERLAADRGLSLAALDLDGLDALWEQAKIDLRGDTLHA